MMAGFNNTQASIIAYTGNATFGGVGGNLNIGREFAVTGSGITILELGVFDYGGNGLINSHLISIFKINSGAGGANANVSLLPGGTVTVLGGMNGPLIDSFRFASLATVIYLAPGNYSIIAYGLNSNGGDPYGDHGGLPSGGNVTNIPFDPFQFTSATSPAYPIGGDSNNHTSVSFLYNLGNTISTSVPEPETFVLFSLGFGGLFRTKFQKAKN